MKLSWTHLFTPIQVVTRGQYATVGIIGFAIKHNLDRLIASLGFGYKWDPINYVKPLSANAAELSNPDFLWLVFSLLASAIPFIWVGVCMTVNRLRHLRWPLWLAGLFFVPFGNLIFFFTLAIMPAGSSAEKTARPLPFLDRFIPKSMLGSALVAMSVATILGCLFTLMSVFGLEVYGAGLFVGLPFMQGLISVLIYNYHQRHRLRSNLFISILTILVSAAFIFFSAVEGLICLMMAAPLGMVLAMLGGLVAHWILKTKISQNQLTSVCLIAILLVPGWISADSLMDLKAPVKTVMTSVIIDADQQKVWDQLVAFSRIDPPTEWLFRSGVAYPIEAKIFGQGVGAKRHCIFTTGTFVEPITIWNEPHQLQFSVEKQPEPMEEFSPYGHIDAPHLHGYMGSVKGQFLLKTNRKGQTVLEGTTWYFNKMWPQPYWKLWADYILHKVHYRVLNHIKKEAES